MVPSAGARSTPSSANRLRSLSPRPTLAIDCLAAHTALGSLALVAAGGKILASRRASAVDAKRDAGLKFAPNGRGQPRRRVRRCTQRHSCGRIHRRRDSEAEIVAHVALNIFTNYINLVARTIVDFPRVELSIGAAACSPFSEAGRTREFDRPPRWEPNMSTIKPPFTSETAPLKVQAAEDAWNSRDPERVALAYSEDSEWRNRTEFLQGRDAIKAFLRRKSSASSTTGSRRRSGGFGTTAWL